MEHESKIGSKTEQTNNMGSKNKKWLLLTQEINKIQVILILNQILSNEKKDPANEMHEN